MGGLWGDASVVGGGAGVGRRAFLRSLGRASAGVAALGTGAVGLGVGLGLGGCASDDAGGADEVRGAAGVPLGPPDFAAMFQPGVRYRFDEDIGGGEAVVEVDEVGDVYLATGRLVATDPFWVFPCGMGDGAYPVWIGRASSGDPTCFIADLEILSHTSGPITD